MGSMRPSEGNAMGVGVGGSHFGGCWLQDLLTQRFCIPRAPPYFTGCLAIEAIARVTQRWCGLINPTVKSALEGYRHWGSNVHTQQLHCQVSTLEKLSPTCRSRWIWGCSRQLCALQRQVRDTACLSVGEPVNEYAGLYSPIGMPHNSSNESISLRMSITMLLIWTRNLKNHSCLRYHSITQSLKPHITGAHCLHLNTCVGKTGTHSGEWHHRLKPGVTCGQGKQWKWGKGERHSLDHAFISWKERARTKANMASIHILEVGTQRSVMCFFYTLSCIH